MASRPVKLKLLPRSVMKAKNVTRLVGQVAAGDGITVVKAAGNFTVSVNAGAGIFQLADGDLTALAALSGTGIARRTGAGAWSVGTTASIAEGGTGQVTAAAGFDALAPTTTRGDIIFRNATTNARLAAGTSGYALIAAGAGADPAWTGFTQTGTGAVVRTWASKAQDVLHGTDFGIVADGVTDNATALANLQAKAVATQKKIVLPPGTIYSTAAITLTGQLTIEGAGHGLTVLSFAVSTNGINAGPHTLTLRDLQINTDAIGVILGDEITANLFSLIERVYFLEPSVGISISDGGLARIINCDFNGFISNGIAVAAPLNPDGGDCLIHGNWFLAATGATSIYHTGGGGWRISNNKMLGGSYGFFTNSNFGNNACSSLIISNNSIEGTTVAMIAIANGDGLGNLYRVIIAGNQGGGESRGIYILDKAGAAWIQHVDISGNLITMHDLATSAIQVAGVTHLGVAGNVIDNFGTGATAYIIASSVNGGHVDLSFTDNFTTRYTNASANVFITDIQGNFAVATGKTVAINNTLTIGGTDGSIVSFGNNFATTGNSITLTVTGATNVTLPTTGTLATLAGSEAFTNKTYNGNTWTAGTGTLTIAAGKTATISNTLTFTGTDASSVAFGAGGTVSYAPAPAPITASLGADVDLNNTANYFTGPSIAQGSTGTWFVSGQVTVLDTASATTFFAKLWDGTTVVASGSFSTNGAAFAGVIALSGFITAPAGNLRISVRDIAFTTGKIKFNATGESKDSTITAYRIA